jgi:hypothetical protein
MSTISEMNAIMANITTGGLNTAVEALACWNILKNEFFTGYSTDTQAGVNLITKTSTNITYNVVTKKMGNQVIQKISITNTSGSTITPTELFKITDSAYLPRTISGLTNNYMIGYMDTTTFQPAVLRLEISSGKYYNVNDIPAGKTLKIEAIYFVNS